MEWLILGVLALFLLGATRTFPALLAPRCPICGTRMQASTSVRVVLRWNGLTLCWRNFVCPQCLYRREFLRLMPRAKDMTHEARAVH